MSLDPRKEALAQRLSDVRKQTLCLLEHVPEEFLRQRVHSFYSPIGWHFGHVGRTEDYWVSVEALGEPPLDSELDFLFTDRPDNPKDRRTSLPERGELVAYLARTRARTLAALAEADLASTCPFFRDGYAWEFAIQHECQHQETIVEMLCLIQAEQPIAAVAPTAFDAASAALFVPIEGGTFAMGSNDAEGYDNEKRLHEVTVSPFELAATPATVSEWFAFIEDGGYTRSELWSPEGEVWRMRQAATAPFYWRTTGDGWAQIGPMGTRTMHPREPVYGVSHFEAEAFARWAEARLPSEAEWEFAARAGRYPWGDARPSPDHARFEVADWAPAPVGIHPAGASPEGVFDLAGNVWEWTATPFLPYPGFAAFPYDGYSKDHMKGEHRVCRGGSWATCAPILRRTFRNWYVPSYRQGFLGVRLAR